MTDPITQVPTEDIEKQNEATRSQQRIQQLSEKVELTAKERDEKAKLLEERDARIATLEKENTFNSGFADILATQPKAIEHKDAIKEKVLAGYSVEDATFAVLGKAGQLGVQVQNPHVQVAGGSATTNPQGGQKDVKDLSLAEKREILAKELIWQ